MFKFKSKPMNSAQISKIIKDSNIGKNSSEEKTSKELKRLKSLLSRKDVVDLDNDKIDALRMLVFYFENTDECSASKLVKFLKK